MSRLSITKTPKVYVGGAFIRSESGRTFPLLNAAGELVGHIPQCTRKDLRNAVEAAAKAGPGWAKRTAYNRGQILYRLAEMLEARSSEMSAALTMGSALETRPPGRVGDGEQNATSKKTSSAKGIPAKSAAREVAAAVDRLIHYAGWTDKYEQVLGSVNPVAAPYFNFTVTEPMGVVGVLAPDEAPLLALISLIAPVIASGNTVVAFASEARPYPALVLGEMLATSDLPGGVVNLLTGFRKELVPTFATHAHVRALSGVASADERKTLESGAAESVKRVRLRPAESMIDWYGETAQSVYAIRDFVEFKTTWHPVGA